MKTAIALSLAAALSLAGTAYAQTSAQGQSSGSQAGTQAGKVDRDTQKFFEQAAVGGMAEVQTGKLAAEKATNPEVKKFGEMMVQDHTKSNEEMMQLATKLGVTPPAELDREHKRMQEKLTKASGAEFDREYIAGQVKDHKKMIDLHEKQAKDGKNPEVKQHAEKMLPSLREHLKMAQDIEKQLKSDKGAGKGTS